MINAQPKQSQWKSDAMKPDSGQYNQQKPTGLMFGPPENQDGRHIISLGAMVGEVK